MIGRYVKVYGMVRYDTVWMVRYIVHISLPLKNNWISRYAVMKSIRNVGIFTGNQGFYQGGGYGRPGSP